MASAEALASAAVSAAASAAASAAVSAAASAAMSAVVLAESRPHSSQHNLPACKQGLPRTLHWQPSLRNSGSHRSTLASAEALALAEEAAALVSLLKSRHRSSQHNLPACKQGLPHILHWRPSLRNSDSGRSILASAEDLASAAALASAVALESVLVQRLLSP